MNHIATYEDIYDAIQIDFDEFALWRVLHPTKWVVLDMGTWGAVV